MVTVSPKGEVFHAPTEDTERALVTMKNNGVIPSDVSVRMWLEVVEETCRRDEARVQQAIAVEWGKRQSGQEQHQPPQEQVAAGNAPPAVSSSGAEPQVEQEEKDDAASDGEPRASAPAAAAAAPAAPAAPADMALAQQHREQRRQLQQQLGEELQVKVSHAATEGGAGHAQAEEAAAGGASGAAGESDGGASQVQAEEAAASGASAAAGEDEVWPGPEEALWKLRRRLPVAAQPKLEGARVGSVKPRPRRGRAAGSIEERLPRRPAARSVVYLRTFKDTAKRGFLHPFVRRKRGCSAFPLPSRTRARVARDLGGNCA
ncbi:hypothetical protein Esi_0276_0024 [Ectocarpus siliculosus]|uniref:Uncharacterized protein n=1 Tax=Ectocarpus siliculosus TaxID=2880 RepID=D7FUQ1_ECTSI|nr:hypothetical protein Esi_0276_0024 [Ectocarpus siliculosus]|eukprot:CBJ31707.1 hypothetical protein Esi_0276_0024 [Ectocarpus siliculosus]